MRDVATITHKMKNSLKDFFSIFLYVIFIMACFTVRSQTDHDTLDLKEVEIIGHRNPYPCVQVECDQEDEPEAIRDIGDFLRSEPNISGIRKGGIAIDPVIRGFKYDQVNVFLNGGVKIEGGCPNRMDPVASHTEMENIDRIEIVKGPYVLKYGPVMGALINLVTHQPKPPEKPGIHGSALYGFETNWNGQKEQANVYGGNEKNFFNVSGGYKDYGNYTAGNEIRYQTSFTKANATAGAGFNLGNDHLLTFNYSYDMGRNVMFPALPMDERSDDTHVLFANYTSGLPGKNFRTIGSQVYYSDVHHVMDNLDRPSSATMEAVTTVDAFNAGGKAEAKTEFGKIKWITGVDFEHVYKEGTKKMTMIMNMDSLVTISTKYSNIWNGARTDNVGWYNEFGGLFHSLSYILAFRLDYNHANSLDTFLLVKDDVSYFDKLETQFLNFSFGAGIRVPFNDQISLAASIGRGTRSPSLLERYIKLLPVQFDPYDYLGNPRLKPEKNHQADLSFDYRVPKLGTFTAGGFFSLVTDYIIGEILPPSVITPASQGTIGVKQYNNIDAVYLTGFEFSYVSPDAKMWALGVNLAATWGTNPKAVEYLVSDGEVIGQETVYNDPLPEIPPFESNIYFSWKFFRSKLKAQAIIQMAGAQNRVSEAFAEKKTPGFITAGLSLRYSPCRYFTLTAGVDNVFDSDYYEHLNRRMTGTTENLHEPGRVCYFTAFINF